MKLTVGGHICTFDAEDVLTIAGTTLRVDIDKDGKPYLLLNEVHFARLKLGLTSFTEKADHRNGDTLDNRRCNLRAVSNRTNSQNTHLRRDGKTASQYLGVSVNKRSRSQPYRVRSYRDRKQVSLGSFANEHEAALVYNTFVAETFGIEECGGFNLLGSKTTDLS